MCSGCGGPDLNGASMPGPPRSLQPLLAAGLAGLLLVGGCGGGRERARELVLAHGGTAAQKELYVRIAADFRRAHPEIPLRLLPISGDYYGKLLVLMAARAAPDVIWMGQGFGEFAARGVFLDVEERARRDPALAPDRFFPEVVQWYRIGGRLKGFPVAADCDYIAYNEALFDAAGVRYPASDWTMDDFVAAARRLTRDADGDGRPEVWGFRGGMDFAPFGATLLTRDGRRADVGSPQMAAALRFNNDLVRTWKVSPPIAPQEIERQEAVTSFQAGRVAMALCYTWNLPELREKMTGKRWDIAPIPVAARRACWASSQGFCISRETRQPEAAWELLRYLVSSDALGPLFERSYPVNRRVGEELLRENRVRPFRLAVLRDQMPYLQPNPRVANLSELLASYEDACQRAYEGRATVQQAMNAAALSMDEVLERRH